MMKDGEYTTRISRDNCNLAQPRGVVEPAEALEVAAVLEVILDAAERLFATAAGCTRPPRARHEKKVGNARPARSHRRWDDDPEEAEKGKGKS